MAGIKAEIELEEFFLPVIVLAFTAFFYYTSTLETCTYRRYVFPAMFLLLAVSQASNAMAALLLAASAVLAYYGYKGYGRQMLNNKTD